MGDGSSAFVLEVLELYRGANDTTTLQLYWPALKAILGWQMRMSADFAVPRGPSSRPNRVLVCAARTLNATGPSRVTLSLRQEQLRAGCGPRQVKRGA